ncbi:hypothetical protein CEXT_146851, partial [Caerostris extrusa]
MATSFRHAFLGKQQGRVQSESKDEQTGNSVEPLSCIHPTLDVVNPMIL